ncbi:hypothetical protein [Salsipaludibacter albus]|uniref:hypothetical protein n=1 Tax=Salsipaludibacter albus TaxID=2849650 RepID=UPI001EE428B5|nr:hypothetical protein [Salsipaludibacter albus]MBY5164277.1 hypothetical protein [Salsipaludibacter albus]
MSGRTGLYTTDELLALLPALYRLADTDGTLRELLDVVTEQVNVVAEGIEQFHDDQFIETAAPWVAPYVGDLVGYRILHGVVPAVASPRAEVANTISYRRRKGTASMLEQLARDVTGWPARAVEFFELLATTQYMNHVRGHARATADLRGADRLELGGTFQAGAFDDLAHTVDVRRITTGTGRHNIPNVGIFLWRVHPVESVRSPLVAADGSRRRWRFDPLGADQPLFATGRTEQDITHLAGPADVPMPLPRRWLATHVGEYWGAGASLLVERATGDDVTEVDLGDVRICDLADDPGDPGTWFHEPGPGEPDVAIDPVRGRLAIGDPPADDTRLLATFHHGMAVLVGGGGYDRSSSRRTFETVTTVVGGGSLVAALNTVAAGGVVEVVDDDHYTLPGTITASTPAPDASLDHVVVRSANRRRPLLSRSGGHASLVLDPDTTLELEGLVVAGAPLVIDEVADSAVRTLVLRHCTLVPGLTRTADGGPGAPGRASLVVLHPFVDVVLDHCVVGPIVAVEDTEVTAVDSVIDATAATEVAFCGRDAPPGGGQRTVTDAAGRETGDGLVPGGHLTLEACTVVGKVHATRLDVSNSIMLAARPPGDPALAAVWAQRRQVGCVRFSSLPQDARVGRRHRCVPREEVPAGTVPHHTSLQYGDPGHLQLRATTHDAIRRGADDEGEMGVTHELYAPQRETNLRIRLDEYLRFGLDAGFFHAT